MDLKALMDGSDGRWTDERHSRFLNWMEISFVRRMLAVDLAGGGGSVPCRCTEMYGDRRLDRYVPDSATESTQDSRRRSPAAAAAVLDSEPRCSSIFTSENSRKRSLTRRFASLDQVVPEIENSEDDGGASVKRMHGGG